MFSYDSFFYSCILKQLLYFKSVKCFKFDINLYFKMMHHLFNLELKLIVKVGLCAQITYFQENALQNICNNLFIGKQCNNIVTL